MEIWKDIKGYEGLYQVSNKGNVRSVSHLVKSVVCGTKTRISQGRVLRQYVSSNGYYYGVHLCKNNKVKSVMVHRLVAETFCANPVGYDCVDHIDGNSRNNSATNLQWCTHKQNSNNPITKSRMSMSKVGVCGKHHSRAKAVAQLDQDGHLIKVWDFVKDAAVNLHICASSISLCANGKMQSAGGYKWSYNFKIKDYE